MAKHSGKIYNKITLESKTGAKAPVYCYLIFYTLIFIEHDAQRVGI